MGSKAMLRRCLPAPTSFRRGAPARTSVGTARQLLGVCLAVLSLGLAFLSAPAGAYTLSPDGISDQSMPNWDNGFSTSYFAGSFKANCVAGPHIQYVRYVVQWNVMAGSGEPYEHYREQFNKWVEDAGGMGLTLDVSLTSYNGVYPSSKGEYKERLKAVLNQAQKQRRKRAGGTRRMAGRHLDQKT